MAGGRGTNAKVTRSVPPQPSNQPSSPLSPTSREPQPGLQPHHELQRSPSAFPLRSAPRRSESPTWGCSQRTPRNQADWISRALEGTQAQELPSYGSVVLCETILDRTLTINKTNITRLSKRTLLVFFSCGEGGSGFSRPFLLLFIF